MKLTTLRLSLWLTGLLLAACGSAVQQQGPYVLRDSLVYYRGNLPNVVRTHLISDPQELHPVNGVRATRFEVLDLCYQRLHSIHPETGALVPELAALPERSADGLAYTFSLQPEAAWPDGSPITASDALFSYKVLLVPGVNNPAIQPYTEYLKDLTADPEDPRRFTAHFSEYYMNNDNFGIFTYVIDARFYDPEGVLEGYSVADLKALTEAENLPEDLSAWVETFNDPQYATTVDLIQNGSGPYRVTEWIPEQRIVLSRNPAYWGAGRPEAIHQQHPEQIQFEMITDGKAVELQLLQQELDVSTNLSPQAYLNLMRDSTARLHYHLGLRPRDAFTSLALNLRPDGIRQARILDDVQVRQAIAYSLPLQDIIDQVLDSMAQPASSPVSPSNSLYNDTLLPYPYAPDEARARLDAAGWTDADGNGIREKEIDGKTQELRIRFAYPPGNDLVDGLAQRIKEGLEAVGMAIELDPAPDYQRQIQQHTFEMALLSLRSSPFPYDFKQLFHSEGWPNGSNFFGFANARADQLIDQMRVETDPVRRLDMANQIQEILARELPVIPLYVPTKKIAIHRRFNHAQMYPIANYVILNDLYLLKEE
ncbi:MAG: hypothetical protein D6722_06165 [Bacteroidetes bacterium]|nr:MAG: hypothetical protein D6722_06165 [Bacteroidota bacterium]